MLILEAVIDIFQRCEVIMKKNLPLLLVFSLLVSCTPSNPEISPDDTVESITDENTTQNQEHQELKVSINAESTTLCLGCETIITAEFNGSSNDLSDFTWSTEIGTIEGSGNEVKYFAPDSLIDQYVDYISLKVSNGNNEVEEKLPILIIGDDQIDSWVSTNGPYGGNIKEIEISNRNPDILYAAGAGGNVYKTTNAGESWANLGRVEEETIHSELAASEDALFITQLVLSESEEFSSLLVVQDEQLHISFDEGISWSRKDELGNILVIQESDEFPNKILAGGAGNRVYLSENHGQSWSRIGSFSESGSIKAFAFGEGDEYWVAAETIWRSETDKESKLFYTQNKGRNWQIVDFPFFEETVLYSIYVDEKEPEIIYIGLNDTYNRNFSDRRIDDHVFVSRDRGETWDTFKLPFADAMVNVLGKPKGSNKLYISSGGHLYVKELDIVKEFTNLISKREMGDPADIEFHPTDEKIIYLPVHQGDGIRKSIDGGLTWQISYKGLDNITISLLSTQQNPKGKFAGNFYASSVKGEGVFFTSNFGEDWINMVDNGIHHPWLDEIQVSYDEIPRVWIVADTGVIFETTDNGNSFESIVETNIKGINKFNFRYGSIYAISTYPENRNFIYALKNGFGIYSSPNGGQRGWMFLENSEVDYTFTLAIHPEDPDIVFSGYSPKPFQDFGMIRKSEDGGESWTTPLRVENSDGITSIAIDPLNPDRMYAANVGDTGEIWTSDNGGDNWFELNPDLNFTNLHAIETYQGSPDIVYGGVWGGGTHYSVDDGKTWQRLKNDPTISASAILLNPKDPDEIYLSDRTSPKVFHTTNAGEDWEAIFDGGNEYYRVLSSAISASNPDVIYISVFGYQGPFSGDVFRIENGIQEKITGDLPRLPVTMAVDPTDSDIVYTVSHAGAVYKTVDGGKNWDSLSEGAIGLPDSETVSYNAVTVSPFDPSVVYLLAGSDIVGFDLKPAGADPNDMFTIYRSVDGGTNWENLNNGYLGELSGGTKDIAFDTNNPNNLFLATVNGVFLSRDNGDTWEDVTGNLGFKQISGLSISSDGTRINAATLGGGIISGRISGNRINWESKSNLLVPIHNIQINIHPEIPEIFYASAYPGGIFKTLDGGENWIECNFGLPSFYVQDPTRQGYYAIRLAPSNPETIYLGIYGIGMYKSEDGGNTWIAKNGQDQIIKGKDIYSLIVDPEDEDKVLISSAEGVFKTLDGGENWESVNEGLNKAQIRVLETGIGNTVYGGTLGSEIVRLDGDWKRWSGVAPFSNYAVRWPIWNDRPLYQYTTVLFNPNDPDIILVGTFPAGIYKSIDGGEHFVESNYGFGKAW